MKLRYRAETALSSESSICERLRHHLQARNSSPTTTVFCAAVIDPTVARTASLTALASNLIIARRAYRPPSPPISDLHITTYHSIYQISHLTTTSLIYHPPFNIPSSHTPYLLPIISPAPLRPGPARRCRVSRPMEPAAIRPIDVRHLGREGVVCVLLVGDVLIDCGPARACTTLLEALGDVRPRVLALTHIHLDHAGAAGTLVERWPGPRGLGARARRAAPDRPVAGCSRARRRLYGDDMDRLWGEVRPVPEAERARAARRRDGSTVSRSPTRPGTPPTTSATGTRRRAPRSSATSPACGSRRAPTSSRRRRRPTSTSRRGRTRSRACARGTRSSSRSPTSAASTTSPSTSTRIERSLAARARSAPASSTVEEFVAADRRRTSSPTATRATVTAVRARGAARADLRRARALLVEAGGRRGERDGRRRPRAAGPDSALGGRWNVIVRNDNHNTFDHVARRSRA